MNPGARQDALLDAQAAAWERRPPAHGVLVAGITGGIPAVARLPGVVARLPSGRFCCRLDTTMAEAAWDGLDDSHPQAGLRRLLTGLGATRGDVRALAGATAIPVPPERFETLGRALLPAEALAAWRVTRRRRRRVSPASPCRPAGGAAAIALTLRDALEMPGARAALVTTDRELAGRVGRRAVRLAWSRTTAPANPWPIPRPPCSCACSPVRWPRLAPVPLLALLKHPLAAAGLSPAACRAAARGLELACLRGPRPARTGRAAPRARQGAAGAPAATCCAGWKPAWNPHCESPPRSRSPPPRSPGRPIDAAERLAATTRHRPSPALGRRGRRRAGRHAGRRPGGAALLPDQRRSRPAGPAGRAAARRGGAQPSRPARTRRRRTSARVHLGPAGGPPAKRRRDGSRRPGRRRLAAGNRSRPLAVAADACQGRACLAEEGGRPGGP